MPIHQDPIIRCKIVRSYSNRTNHVFEFCQDVSYSTADDDGTNPSSDKSFDCFFGRKTDEWGTSPNHSADICEYIVRDDETDGKEEPNQSFEDRVDNEMRLEDDEEESHMSPTELRELIRIRSRGQCHHKEYKT